MQDYEPIDLAGLCNAGLEFAQPLAEPRRGPQTYHGLPFVIGGTEPETERCFLGFGGDSGAREPVRIPLDTTARHLIVAHTLLESRIAAGDPPGDVVAHYCLRYVDGTEVRIPIRERFEIAVVPTAWGQLPFLAHADHKDALMPRHLGPWDAIGARQTEVSTGWPEHYYLWAWTNPNPDRLLAALVIEPTDRKLLVAALTASHLEEAPFSRTAMREVKISLPEPADAARPFALDTQIDRGMAGYTFALPQNTADRFIADDHKGFGEAQNEHASPAYVEVTGLPSATLTVSQDGEELGRVRWGELEDHGAVETPRVSFEVVDRGRNWVHVTVLDDETGRPVPCRVHFRSPEGIPYQPHGHHHHVNSNLGTWHIDIGGDLRLGQITYAYIDGQCQGWLPRGEVIVDVARGFEYEPLRTRVQIAPGQQELTLRLKRWTNQNARRWFSGDSHVHFVGGQGGHLEAQGEDLNVVNLLQSQWGHLFTNTEDWIGEPTLSNGGQTIVYCSQENRQHMLGHLTLWGLKQPVMPWCSDGPSEAELGGALETTLSHWADEAHRQGGTVIIPHLPTPNGEPAALIATGRADAVEMLQHGNYQHLEYYRYLNGGYRLPLVGGTDKMSSDVPVGLYRTYAYVPADEELSYDSWCRAVRSGRTFLSGGPMLTFSVDGAAIGDTLTLPRGGGEVEVEATAESIFPLHTLQIVSHGEVIAMTEDRAGSRRLHLNTKIRLDRHTWLAARCGGPEFQAVPHHDCWGRGIFAHTSPIYVAVGEAWSLADAQVAHYMLTLIDGSLGHIRTQARTYPPGSVTYHHGEHDHQAYLERPFHEAIAAIHEHLHRAGVPH